MVYRRFLLVVALVAAAAVACVAQPAQARAAEPQKLFALDAEQGTLTPVKSKPGIHRLVLEDVRARALYFTDRPVREVGTVALRRMLRALFAGDSSPPNAAVNATAPKRGQLLMGVELRSWHYDARAKRLTLRVRHLRQGRQRTFERVRNDVVLPRSFRDVSVFIDNCCADSAPGTIFNPGLYELTVTVNGGPELDVPGASPSWLPGSAAVGFDPHPSRQPQPGVLGPGPNYVRVTVDGLGQSFSLDVNLPTNVGYPVLQLYVYQGRQPGWTALGYGQVVASGVGF